jgi:hypothetical protein
MVDTVCHAVSSFVTKTLYAQTVHTAPMLPFVIASLPVLTAAWVVTRLTLMWAELRADRPGERWDEPDERGGVGPDWAGADLAKLEYARSKFGADDPRFLEARHTCRR